MIPATAPEDLTLMSREAPQTYRLNVVAMVILGGLDIARLDVYRRAVTAGFYTDEVK